MEIATWQCFLFVTWPGRDDVTSTCLICLIWFLLMDLLLEFDGHWFSGNGDTNSYINFYMKKLNSPPRSAILRDFQNLEYWFAIPKPRTRLAEKREGNEEYSCKALCFSRKCKKQLQFKCMTCNPDWLCSDAGQNIWHKRNFGTNWTRVENSEFWFCITSFWRADWALSWSPPHNYEIFPIFPKFLRSWVFKRLATLSAIVQFPILNIKFYFTIHYWRIKSAPNN